MILSPQLQYKIWAEAWEDFTLSLFRSLPHSLPLPLPPCRSPSPYKDGDTPLLCACWHGYQNVVECLTQAGCSLQTTNNEGETALHIAAVRGYYGIVRFLCESGAQLDSADNVCGRVAQILLMISN